MEERVKGICKWFNDEKGYGFIISGNTDYFLHITELKSDSDELKEGDDVEFSIQQTEKGFSAINVTKV